ncbi:MAG: beta-lactamase family protein [Abditibacteriales bacterium]|nr:beta-lactamase family protein [Abditibacteriales bacterium]MDW8364302.1 serine hydrolase domain-containing protein [Abditibacteriales bacterium]
MILEQNMLRPGRAEDVGISRARLERVTLLMEDYVKEGKIPGAAMLVARRGIIVLHRGFGQMIPLGQTEREPRITQPDTIFLVASPTKPIVATAVALLIERGQLLLDDPVSSLLPEFSGADRREVRVRHLLTHTSGLPDMLPENVELRQQRAPLEEFLRRTCTTPLLFAPGTDCRYQSMGILLLGAIVERIAGVSLREFLEYEFFIPLAMTDSYLGMGRLRRERIATVTLTEQEEQQWTWNSDYWRDLGAPWGGMHTTVGDYAIFLQMLLNGGRYAGKQILSQPLVDTMTANHIPPMPDIPDRVKLEQAWGLGWRLNQPRGAHHIAEIASPRAFGHAGATGTTAWADPDTGLICVIFTNQPQAGRLLNTLSNAVAATVID